MKYEDLSASAAGSIVVPNTESASWYVRSGKRLFDVAFALALLPLLVPVIAVLWVLTRMDGGPGFFGHERIGKGGVPFKCWKLRSMVVDADKRLEALLKADPVARAEWERDRKLNDDPRITRFGDFIRQTSLDELPQIINVLSGDMSFVGPRPIVQDELAKYGVHKATYMSMKPGITGLWQVSGRNSVSYARRVSLDSRYSNRISPSLDAWIIAATAGSMLKLTGR